MSLVGTVFARMDDRQPNGSGTALSLPLPQALVYIYRTPGMGEGSSGEGGRTASGPPTHAEHLSASFASTSVSLHAHVNEGVEMKF